MSDKKYFGNCKEATFNHNGQQFTKIRIGLSRDHLQEMISLVNDKGWINLDLSQRASPSQYGDTHSLSHNDWKPDTSQAREAIQSISPQSQSGQPNQHGTTMDNMDQDIPF